MLDTELTEEHGGHGKAGLHLGSTGIFAFFRGFRLLSVSSVTSLPFDNRPSSLGLGSGTLEGPWKRCLKT